MKIIIQLCITLITLTPTLLLSAEPGSANVLRVRILMNSGLKDPTFLISDLKVIGEVTTFVNSLPKDQASDKKTVIPSKLGYRGIAIENISLLASDIDSITLSGKEVEILRSNVTPAPFIKDFRIDNSASLERRLLDIAADRRVISPRVLERIRLGTR